MLPLEFPTRVDFLYCALYEGDTIHKEMTIPYPGLRYTFQLDLAPSWQNKTVCVMGYVKGERGDPQLVFEHAKRVQDLFPYWFTLPTSCGLEHRLFQKS